MRREWIFGFGAVSTLAVLVGLDLMIAVAAQKGKSASQALLRNVRRAEAAGPAPRERARARALRSEGEAAFGSS